MAKRLQIKIRKLKFGMEFDWTSRLPYVFTKTSIKVIRSKIKTEYAITEKYFFFIHVITIHRFSKPPWQSAVYQTHSLILTQNNSTDLKTSCFVYTYSSYIKEVREIKFKKMGITLKKVVRNSLDGFDLINLILRKKITDKDTL